MFVLGRFYYVYVPFLTNLGLLGALLLGGVFILVFMGIGWIYDSRMKMWASKNQAVMERNPYYYVPNPRASVMEYPVLFALLTTIEKVQKKLGMDSSEIRDLNQHIESYFRRNPVKEDIEISRSQAQHFRNQPTFLKESAEEMDISGPVSLGDRAKLGFEVEMLRVSWVQNLTGLFQDALVFSAFYVVFLIPGAQPNEPVPVEYIILGIFMIAIPLFFLLAAIGWFYDRKLQVWSPERIVLVERNPYSYVPQPYYYGKNLPMLYTMLYFTKSLQKRIGVSTEETRRLVEYLDAFHRLGVADEGDMQRARDLLGSYGEAFAISEESAT